PSRRTTAPTTLPFSLTSSSSPLFSHSGTFASFSASRSPPARALPRVRRRSLREVKRNGQSSH
ncbi:MAG: hypothetical protein ACK439_11570, partial [Novosphingobium sp.]